MHPNKWIIIATGFLALLSCDNETKHVPLCGDDYLDPGEDCDGEIVGITCGDLGHYNVNGVLSCRSDCTYNLADCGGRCGDGVVETGFNEQCDNDNLGGATCESLGFRAGTLACSDECHFDTSACESTCGNGQLDAWELCDGAQLGGASCQSLGYSGGALACRSDCTFDEQSCQTVCGNAVLETGEECDGNKLRGLTCEALGYESGTLGCTAGCMLDRSGCMGTSTCGNGALDAPETCDGADLGGATCVSSGYQGGVLSCGLDCRLDFSRCVGATCGNGQVDTGETCEPTAPFSATCRDLGYLGGSLTCSSSCQWNTLGCNNIDLCGNGTADNGEACDGTDFGGRTCVTEGFYTGSVTCNADCSVNTAACSGFCGDGTLDAAHGEACDGALLGTNTCVTAGFYEGTLACDDACQLDTAGCSGRCGDGTMDADFGEACDGADFGGRTCYSGTFACLANCQINDFNCQGYCGDGTIQSGFEECDGATFDPVTKPCGELGFAGGTRTCELSTCTPQYNCLTWVKVVGAMNHRCAIDSQGNLWCWGEGDNGKLGNGTMDSKDRPTRVLGPNGMGFLENVTDLSLGLQHSCAMQSSGAVWCWGLNNSGQLGDGSTTNSLTPVRVRGPGGSGYLNDVAKLGAGYLMNCALKTDETLWCWGNNWDSHGCLGVNSTASNIYFPTQVSGVNGIGVLQEVKDFSLINTYSCGGKAIVGASRTVVTWGDNSQQNPANQYFIYPVYVKDIGGTTNLSGILKIADSQSQACAIKNNRNVVCWGTDFKGNNTTRQLNIYPTDVLNQDGSNYFTDADEITAIYDGNSIFCIRSTSGSVSCWGDNLAARLGIGNVNTPVLLPTYMLGTNGNGNMTDAISLTHFCLLKTNGTINCWAHEPAIGDGENTYGHSSNYVLFPVPVLGSAP